MDTLASSRSRSNYSIFYTCNSWYIVVQNYVFNTRFDVGSYVNRVRYFSTSNITRFRCKIPTLTGRVWILIILFDSVSDARTPTELYCAIRRTRILRTIHEIIRPFCRFMWHPSLAISHIDRYKRVHFLRSIMAAKLWPVYRTRLIRTKIVCATRM